MGAIISDQQWWEYQQQGCLRLGKVLDGAALAALQQRINRAEGFPDDFLHAHEAATDTFFRELKNSGFNVVKNFFGGIALVGGAGNGRIRGVDQSAQQRLVANNLDVVLDAWPVRNSVDQPGNVADIADSLEFFGAIELVNQRDHVDRPRRLGEIDHSAVNPAMRVERKVFRLQVLGSLVVRQIVEQDRAQDGALGFNIRRKRVREAVVGGRQRSGAMDR